MDPKKVQIGSVNAVKPKQQFLISLFENKINKCGSNFLWNGPKR
jgi:hypothetical protein